MTVAPDSYEEGVQALREIGRGMSRIAKKSGPLDAEDRDYLQLMAGILLGLALRLERLRPEEK
jgi:hypothetical protein